jgi:UPF0755 protein
MKELGVRIGLASRRFLSFIAHHLSFIISLCLLCLLVWIAQDFLLPMGRNGMVSVEIPNDASALQISRILAGRGAIRSAWGFRVLARVEGKSASLHAGLYVFSRSMTPMGVLRKIAAGEANARWIVIPEGFTVRQIAYRLGADKCVRPDKFISLALECGKTFQTGFVTPGDSLEGYLFPSTYLISKGESEDKIVNDMLRNFDRKVAIPLKADIDASGMSLHEILTLASLIEKEAKVPGDRPLISAVLRNRIQKNMRLQIDATVLYALGHHKNRVYYKDLTVDSPYNTYRHAGLPPGPIANPGLDSIKAAIHPANVDYLYYVAKPDGSHIFSRTIEEHAVAIKQARGKDAH